MRSWTLRPPSRSLRRRLFDSGGEAESETPWMGLFAPVLSAACLAAAAMLPAGVPGRAQADPASTNSALMAALDHGAQQSLLNNFAAPSFTSTNISSRRSTNALSTGWN